MVIDQDGLTATTRDGNIKYTVTSPGKETLTNTTGTANVVVKAEYVSNDNQGNAQNVAAQLTVAMNYVQK
ncbi:MAG: hypothetical protein PUA73_02245, partial [Bacilli bacterium]|nr:hypothetical protein [Bacilli bacterium]